MIFDEFQMREAARRFRERSAYRARNERLIKQHRYLEVDTPERVQKFLAHHGVAPSDTARLLGHTGSATPTATESVGGVDEPFALERILGTNDLMGVVFLESGLNVSRTVGRVWIGVTAGSPVGYGTGFMVSPRLMLTNHHVLGDPRLARTSQIEFQYQIGLNGSLMPTSSFGMDVDAFHVADQALDYALVAVQPVGSNGKALAEFGWNPLLIEEGKAIVSQWINIVQHPNAEPKQLALRENQLIDVFDAFLHYKTDTAAGSSGSPLYNDRWEVIGLHHSGVPKKNEAGQVLAVDGQVWRSEMGEQRISWIANEGIRISRILAGLKDVKSKQMNQEQRKLLDEMLSATSRPAGSYRYAPPEAVGSGLTTTGGAGSTSSVGGGANGSAQATVKVGADGSATWTIPLSVTVSLGGRGGGAIATPAASPLSPPLPPPPGTGPIDRDPQEALAAARRQLGGRADVLDVRLGYVFKDGWITGERAIVVTVPAKKPHAALREANVTPLPDTIGGFPVEVTGPTIKDLVRLARGPAVAEEALGAPETLGQEITYQPPQGAHLDAVKADMHVIASVSPDAGWTVLEPFLAGTKKRLTIGMYDFGAPHIVKTIEDAGKKAAFEKLTLVMQAGEDVGSGTKKDDLKDEQVVDRFRNALHGKFENAWVKIGRVNGWVSSSYHIKVAVRDRSAFWLSSGNLQTSNQPDVDPLSDNPPKAKYLSTYNREWHATIENAKLAQTYEEFLLNDFEANKNFDPDEAFALRGVLPDVFVPEALFNVAAEERLTGIKYFQPFDDKRVFSVQPLLTPDNYLQFALDLIKGAKNELLIQNQTFNAPGDNHASLEKLVSAVLDRQNKGVDVKIIFRVLFAPDARKNVEALVDFGLSPDSIKVQKNCHTKGIIADRKRVMLGSQNISNDGVSVNRDASLLFDDEPLAKYFAAIFDHDWNKVAEQNIGNESLAVRPALPDESTPAGMVRLSWKDYMEMA